MASLNPQFVSPAALAEQGQKIYDEKYRAEYESKFHGKYVAIDIRNGNAAVGDSPEDAVEKARLNNQHGLFHLVRVGFPGVYSGSTLTNYAAEGKDWLFGR